MFMNMISHNSIFFIVKGWYHMVTPELEHQAIEIVEAILTEIKAAKKYFHMAVHADNAESKKMLVDVAENELSHYRRLKDMFDKEKTGRFKDMHLDMPIVNILMDDLDRWADEISDGLSSIKTKLGIK